MPARDPIDIDRVRSLLGERWARIDAVAETPSTNLDLLEQRGAADRTALVAEHQTAGRGRLDRAWSSPPGAGLTFSALLRPGVSLLRWGWLPLLAGVALADAVRTRTGVEVALKWPNDLLAPDGGKLAGILVQTADDVVVIGIGLNVSTTREELPVETATSLALEGATELDRTMLLVEILQRLDTRAAQWADCGGDSAACGLTEDYRGLCATLGRQVRVRIAAGRTVEGTALDVDETGRLVLRNAEGEHRIGAGDVEQLRRA